MNNLKKFKHKNIKSKIFLSHEQTLTNCLIAAAFITYSGPFDRDCRIKLCKFFVSICQKLSIPKEPQQIFKVFTFLKYKKKTIFSTSVFFNRLRI